MSSQRSRQKSLEKEKNKRLVAVRNAATASSSPSRSATLKLAASSPVWSGLHERRVALG